MPRFAVLTVALLLSPLTPALASTVSIQATPDQPLAPTTQPVETSCGALDAADCVVEEDDVHSEADDADQAGGEDQGGDSGE